MLGTPKTQQLELAEVHLLRALSIALLLSALQAAPQSTLGPAQQSQSGVYPPCDPVECPLRHVGGRVSEPTILYKPAVLVPEEVKRQNLRGVVVVNLVVDRVGNPRRFHVIRSLFPFRDEEHYTVRLLLDQAVTDGVARYRFAPAMEDGKAVPVQVNIDVEI